MYAELNLPERHQQGPKSGRPARPPFWRVYDARQPGGPVSITTAAAPCGEIAARARPWRPAGGSSSRNHGVRRAMRRAGWRSCGGRTSRWVDPKSRASNDLRENSTYVTGIGTPGSGIRATAAECRPPPRRPAPCRYSRPSGSSLALPQIHRPASPPCRAFRPRGR